MTLVEREQYLEKQRPINARLVLRAQFSRLADLIEARAQEVTHGLGGFVDGQFMPVMEHYLNEVVENWWLDNKSVCRVDGGILGMQINKEDVWFRASFEPASGALSVAASPTIVKIMGLAR